MIRKMVRNILLETRGPLGITPVLKEWVKVAAEHGVLTDPRVTGPGGSGIAEHACLKVPRAHAPKVFAALTPDLKEWCLKHWRSEEYFNEMISGVIIGLIRYYEKSNYAGMKSGFTNINGAINAEGKKVGSMGGYLTTKNNENRTDWNYNPYARHRRHIWNNGELNRDGWQYSMLEDIAETESTLVHEFQHWFQESIYYAENMKKIPTKRKGKDQKLPDAKERLKNIKSLKPIHLMLAKKGFSGVDWNTTMKVRGAIAYKLSDPEAFFDSYNPTKLKGAYSGEGMMEQALKKIQSKGAMKAFIEEILYDYLKLQKIITPEDIDEIADEAMEGGWNPIKRGTQKRMWDRGHPIRTEIDGKEVHDKSQKSWLHINYNKRRDTPKGSGEKTVQGTDSLLASIGGSFYIYVLRSSDFDNKGNLKPGKEPVKPTEARARKATWVVLGHGEQSLPHRSAWASEYTFRQERGLRKEKSGSKTEWTDRWVEFDAVAAEYTVAVIKRVFEYGSEQGLLWSLVRGDDERFAEIVSEKVKIKVRRRGFDHLQLEVNQKHIESMVERITDRLIETIEQNPYEDWLGKHGNKPPWSPTNAKPASTTEFDEWASNEVRSERPWTTGPYWEWIFAKASGEDV